MGDITRNLSRFEFACSCGCGLADPHPVLVMGIQRIVDATNAKAVIVTSGSRCDAHNAAVSLVDYSTHEPAPEDMNRGGYTLAADCVFLGAALADVIEQAQEISCFLFGGIGLYLDSRPDGTDRVHLDVRGHRARWGWIDGAGVTFAEAVAAMNERNAE